MILTKHELKQGKLSLLIWTLSIGFLMAVCIFLFPEMKSQMEDVIKFLPLWAALLPPSEWIV